MDKELNERIDYIRYIIESDNKNFESIDINNQMAREKIIDQTRHLNFILNEIANGQKDIDYIDIEIDKAIFN